MNTTPCEIPNDRELRAIGARHFQRARADCAVLSILIFIGVASFPPAGNFGVASAADRYVATDGTNDAAGGYTNWSGAATSVIDAVTAALATETIWISNGVFNLTNNMTLNNNTLRGFNGRDYAIINGMAVGWGTGATTGYYIYVVGGGTINGITMSNGYSVNSYPNGSAIGCMVGNIFNSKIIYCSSKGNGGGGVTLYSAPSTMTNCIIQNNWSRNAGGGVALLSDGGGSPIMQNCIIQYNCADNVGGGVFTLPGAGGGSPIVENCIIRNNTNTPSNEGGGGVWMWKGGTFRNCLIVSNYTTGTGKGGGIRLDSVQLYDRTSGVFNCTIVDNIALGGGGGVRLADTINTNTIFNCIIYSNYSDAAHSSPSDISLVDPVCTNAFWYSCLTNSIPSDRHCITGNPLIVNYAGGNYRLQANSPCINAGTNQDWWMPNTVDLDWRMRVRYGTVDMGAFEHIQSGTIFTFH